jgi:hypothetical protein
LAIEATARVRKRISRAIGTSYPTQAKRGETILP